MGSLSCCKAAQRRRRRPRVCTSASPPSPRTCCAPASACATTCASTAPTRQVIDDVVLCVEEAATNAIRHSGSELDIEISLRLRRRRSRRRGQETTAGASTSRASIARRCPTLYSDHGRGLFIIAKLMDSLELRLDGGLEVHMARRAASRAVRCASIAASAMHSRPSAARRRPHPRHARGDRRGLRRPGLGVPLRARQRAMACASSASRATSCSGSTLWELCPGAAKAARRQSATARRWSSADPRSSSIARSSAATGSRCASTRPPAGISVYYREISERKRIEQEVVATRAELAATLAAITDGFYTLDRDWRVTYLNDKAAEVFPGRQGRARRRLLGAVPRRRWQHLRGQQAHAPWSRARSAPSNSTTRPLTPGSRSATTRVPTASRSSLPTSGERKRAEAERDQLMETTSLLLEAATTAASWTDLDRMLDVARRPSAARHRPLTHPARALGRGAPRGRDRRLERRSGHAKAALRLRRHLRRRQGSDHDQEDARHRLRRDRHPQPAEAVRRRACLPAHARRADRLPRAADRARSPSISRGRPDRSRQERSSWSRRSPRRPVWQ